MNRIIKRIFSFILAASFLCFPIFSVFSEIGNDLPYDWKNVKIGGLGYVTGIVFHPAEPDLVYIRTDVGGAYRWDAKDKRWIQFLDGLTYQDKNLYGVDGIAIDPSDPEVVYVACGMYDYWSPHDVLKSSDRGKTWKRTNLNQKFMSNDWENMGTELQRLDGECLVVDPKNSNIVYCGTRQNGLFVSKNGATTWNKVSAVPNGTLYQGIRTVAFDSTSSLLNGGTRKIYAGVNGIGVYSTVDGGVNWNLMQGSPKNPKKMYVDSMGVLYVSSGYCGKVIDSTGVFKYESNSWTDITPKANTPFGALAVDMNIPGRVIVVEQNKVLTEAIYITEDGGESWTAISGNTTPVPAPAVPDIPAMGSRFFSNGTSSIAINPFDSDNVVFCDGFAVWKTDNISASPILWTTQAAGTEELCVETIVCPPSGAEMLTGVMDCNGFRFNTVEEFQPYPTTTFTETTTGSGSNRWNSPTTGIAYMESDPNIMVRIGHGVVGDREKSMVYTSTNNGANWAAARWPYTGTVSDIAMSATRQTGGNTNPIIIAMRTGNVPVRSVNFGQAWSEVVGLPIISGHNEYSFNRKILEADKQDRDKFYFYDYSTGKFYVSTDGGANFSNTAALPIQGSPWDSFYRHTVVKAKPGTTGEVWVSLYDQGIHYTLNSGASFTKLAGVQEAMSFSFGRLHREAVFRQFLSMEL